MRTYSLFKSNFVGEAYLSAMLRNGMKGLIFLIDLKAGQP